MAPSPLSLLKISCVILSVSGQGYTGPGYLACPFVDFFTTADSVFDCVNVNCTSAQLEACNFNGTVDETTDASFQTYYIALPCECVSANGCPESCDFFTGDLPTLPPVTGFTNYSGVGNVTCSFADYFNPNGEERSIESCLPIIIDPTLCGTCTFDGNEIDYQPGDTTVTFTLPCECHTMLNCPNTCTFVATDGTVEAPVAGSSSTSFAVATTMSHKFCAVIRAMMYVSAFYTNSVI
jgi:hypothetical protein